MKISLLKYLYVKYVVLLSCVLFVSLVVNRPGQVVNYVPIAIGIAVALWLATSDLLQLFREMKLALQPQDIEKRKRVLKAVIEATRIKRFAIMFYLIIALAFLVETYFSA